ncbi:hypothetical protein GCM10009672_02370 [Nesterenkonia lutea]
MSLVTLAVADLTGAAEVTAPQHRDWGGYTGYFADPEGFRWEIAWAPGEVNDIVLPEPHRAD